MLKKIQSMIEEIENEMALLAIESEERNRLQSIYEDLLEMEASYD